MPELPEVETVCRGLAAQLLGVRIRDVEVVRRDLREPVPADLRERLRGQQLVAVQRRAKYILCCFADHTMLVAHLGMTGRFTICAPPPATLSTHDHVVLYTQDGRAAIYSDPRRFGLLVLGRSDRQALHPLLKDLGPEPLGSEFTADSLLAKVARRKSPLKTLLLDQAVVAGLGNIYVSEALWRARLSPSRLGCTLVRREAARLVTEIRAVLNDAIAAGGSTLRDYVQADGSIGGFQTHFAVYDRAGERCAHRGCKGHIERAVHAGRSTYFCPQCQK
ncbi:MAG TPA: bifunctional DNA-formamidopyrimidine glycosylase/DNA-(apurinic or apyrimidinic site) lyase [Pseudomonadota bacterium]|nr:bifunctional DNA-formamidopyrimidine glycosylase/DNA-(apurinic or apyrimidinic site) lyase [Pseudomonadota bacterium]